MRIKVTEDHIRKGCALDCNACPVALAVSDHFPGEDVNVSVASHISVWDEISKVYLAYVRTPEMVGKFMTDFDEGTAVEPFEFDLTTKEAA